MIEFIVGVIAMALFIFAILNAPSTLRKSAQIVRQSVLEEKIELFLDANPNNARLGILRPFFNDKWNVVSVSAEEFIRFCESSDNQPVYFAVFRDETKVHRRRHFFEDAAFDFAEVGRAYLKYQESSSDEFEARKFADWHNELILVAVPDRLTERFSK